MVGYMDIATLIFEALKFIFPAYCTNAVPVLAGGGQPMDFGKNFLDGKRILGKNKRRNLLNEDILTFLFYSL